MEIWLLYAIGAAVFAGLVGILGKIGLGGVNSDLANAIRTVVVFVFAWVIVFTAGGRGDMGGLTGSLWLLIALSGIATGGAWLFRFRSLKTGDVNKVTPVDKSSTILTMLLAIIILGEPLRILTVIGMTLMAVGTWLMIDFSKSSRKAASKGGYAWLLYAVLAAVLAAAVAILGRLGVADMHPNLWTALRMLFVMPFAWMMVLMQGKQKELKAISRKSWIFLILSGLATGASWLFFYHALTDGNASAVVPIDKLSILITMLFAAVILKEKFTKRSVAGLALLTIGTLLPIIF